MISLRSGVKVSLMKKLKLVCDIKKYWGEDYYEEFISEKNNTVTLNYFACINSNKPTKLLKNILDHPLEEIIISSTYQFVTSHNYHGFEPRYSDGTLRDGYSTEIYKDTLKPIKEHLKKSKNKKKIVFEFREEIFDNEWGEYSMGFLSKTSCWQDYTHRNFVRIVKELLSENKNLKISIYHPLFKKELFKNKRLETYFKFFDLYQVFNDNKKFKGRFFIEGYSHDETNLAFNKYLKDTVTSIIVIDNEEYDNDNSFRNIEIIPQFSFDDIGYGIDINACTNSIEFEKSSKNYNKFWDKFREHFYYYDGKNYILAQFKDDLPIIFVKKKFLDHSNKTIFNNIKYFFYLAEDFYDEDKGAYRLQNKILKISDSINFNKPQYINISDGGKIGFKELISKIDVSELKVLILKRVLHNDLTIPYMPKLEEFDFTHRANLESIKDEIITYNKFSNLPNLRKLRIGNLLYEYLNKKKENVAQLGKVDLSDISSLKKLKTLSTWDLEPKYFKQLETLKDVDLEKISLMNLSTDRSFQIDPDSKERIIETEKCFNFLKLFKNLKKLEIHVSDDSDFKINQKFFLNYINKNIGEIKVCFGLKNRSEINAFYKNIVKKFKKIKKLDLSITGQFRNYDNKKKKSKDGEYYYDDKTGKKFKYEKGPDPFIFDIKIFKNLKNLEYLDLYTFDANGYGVKNLLSVIKMKKLKQLILVNAPEIFPTADLKKVKKVIEEKRDRFFEKCKKKDKKIKDRFDLSEADDKKYDELDRYLIFGHGISRAQDIIKDREK
jgi:hypothetical protein